MSTLAILQTHFERYPTMQAQDIYKLIYQGCLGAEHAVASPNHARNRLENEVAEMGEAPPEPIIDPISANGKIIRINLRPYLEADGDLEVLLDAFIHTANDFHGEISLVEKEWDAATQTCFLSTSVMDAFIQKLKERNYPAVHHSEAYKEHYRPAYRVVWQKYFPYEKLGDLIL
jgi:hypothetical protein